MIFFLAFVAHLANHECWLAVGVRVLVSLLLAIYNFINVIKCWLSIKPFNYEHIWYFLRIRTVEVSANGAVLLWAFKTFSSSFENTEYWNVA